MASVRSIRQFRCANHYAFTCATVWRASGRMDDAEWAAEEVLALEPVFTVQIFLNWGGFDTASYRAVLEKGLRAAELP